MSTIINKQPFSTPRNINLKGGLLRFGVVNSSNKFGTVDYGLYVNDSGQLIYSSLGTATVLGGAGGVDNIPSWEQIFGEDLVFVTTGTSFTVRDAGTSTNDILTVEATAAMSGDIIKINNAGTGKDISGAGDTWSITKVGAAVLTDLNTPLITSSAALTIAVAGANAITLGTGTNTITMAKATTFSTTTAFSGTMTATNTSTILTSNSNTVAPLLITDDTVTTYGTLASEGLAVVRSTSLTTGTLLKLQLAGLAQTSGYYLECYDTTDTEKKFTIGEDGAVVIAGNSATTVLTVTAGNTVLTAGNLTLTSGNAVLTAGNLTLTSGNLVMTVGNLTVVGGITSSSPTGNGVGYATGAGGTVTQITNRSTGVTLNTLCGKIQTDTTSLAAGASAVFTLTNSTIAIGDVVLVSQRSGSSSAAGVAGTLIVEVVTVADGSCIISLNNNSSTTAETGAVVINFVVIKAVTA